MPAHTGNIDNVYLPAIGLLHDIADADVVFFGQLFVDHALPESFNIVHLYAQHKVLGKLRAVICLKDEPAFIALKTCVTISLPVDLKTQFYKKLFGAFIIAPRRYKGSSDKNFIYVLGYYKIVQTALFVCSTGFFLLYSTKKAPPKASTNNTEPASDIFSPV